jgi:hypothetical protein
MMLGVIAVFGVGVMLLWNALLPEIFGLPALNYWQAAGILLLSRILFGGLEQGHHNRRNGIGIGLGNHGNKLREKWFSMTEEERKEFIEKERDFLKHDRRYDRFSRDRGSFDTPEEQKKEDRRD